VKETTSRGEKVLLTRNEVTHARGVDAELALYVLVNVMLEAGDDPKADGGVELIFYPWELDESCLRPVGYEYTLGGGAPSLSPTFGRGIARLASRSLP